MHHVPKMTRWGGDDVAYMAYQVRADRLKKYRRQHLLTQQQFADQLGVHIATVQRAERGQPAGRETIRRFCDAIGCKPLELIK